MCFAAPLIKEEKYKIKYKNIKKEYFIIILILYCYIRFHINSI